MSKEVAMGNLRKYFVKKCISLKEKTFRESGRNVKYIFDKKKNSDRLIVVFSGFATSAGYNYMRTLKNVKTNKLFLLDDLGRKDYPGIYYLGENGDYQYKETVMNLIQKIIVQANARNVITVGSSKGGWAALYFGFRLNAKAIIAGAPQYYLGSYLDCDFHHKTFEIMVGNNIKQDKEILDALLPDLVKKAEGNEVYLHYSDKEHTFREHIVFLDEDLSKNKKIFYHRDVKHYEEHSKVGEYFPRYLLTTIKQLV